MNDDELTKGEQKEIRQYIRDRINGKEINLDKLPNWLAELEEYRQRLLNCSCIDK